MVFSSLIFLLVFLPLTIATYYSLIHFNKGRLAIVSLFLASLVYYGYWKFQNLWIIVASILVNYFFGKLIAKQETSFKRKFLFVFNIILNLGLLCYFKYTDFLISTINTVADTGIPLTKIILPIGISFFTFQQIAYISDIYTKRNLDSHTTFLDYCLFVCFFPQLVAGPIVHHHEMMPQFADKDNHRINWNNIYSGIIFLSFGLVKKVLIADTLSPLVKYGFDTTSALSFSEATLSSIAYSLQLYFDFSGYSDMAVGAAFLFNIKLPFNFNSPYQSTSIRDFWRRWHITLSIWLRDYLYIPLGGSRCTKCRTYINLFITMALGGLWHGAAWTFVLWGVLHGSALIIQRIWSGLTENIIWLKKIKLFWWALTFSFVNFAFMIFRAKDFSCIKKFIKAFLTPSNIDFTDVFMNGVKVATKSDSFYSVLITVGIVFVMAIFFKNSIWLHEHRDKRVVFALALLSFIASLVVLIFPNNSQEFIYFQF